MTVFISIAGNSIQLIYPSDLQSLMELIFPSAVLDRPAGHHLATFTAINSGQDVYQVSQGNTPLKNNLSASECGIFLMNEVVREFANAHTQHIAVHAAAVVKDDVAIVMPANSGSGKTSLAAWFTARGYAYISDELVLFHDADAHFEGLYRPLNFKPSGTDTALALKNDRYDPQLIIESEVVSGWPAVMFGECASFHETFQANLFIFPSFDSASELDIRELSPAQAGLELMRSNVNARNLAGQGFNAVGQLARKVPALRLSYGGNHQIAEVLESTIEKLCC